MTSVPAERLGLADRGRLAPGQAADLVVFDARTVANRATPAEPATPPVGIRRVMVNGEWVVVDGRPAGRRPGRAL
jgi:N-acyl-D-amino-acid deacylase